MAPNAHGFVDNLASASVPCNGGGTAEDSCPFDYFCSAAVNGTCSPFAQGTTNPSCIAAPDFTLGLGCFMTSSNINTWTLEVCNRGAVAANTGSLVIDLINSAPSNNTSASCLADTFPNLLQSVGAGTGAYCTIPLASVSISPGECISFEPVTGGGSVGPPAPITCTDLAGGTLTPTSGFGMNNNSQIAAVVNPPLGTAFTPAVTPLLECDICNNYTNIDLNAASLAAAACTSSLCGTAAGSGSGGSTCNTTITGVVMDPGQNVGLSDVAVYVATASAVTFPAEPDPSANAATGAPAGEPYCDSCSSLSTAGYSTGVTTAADGSFTLNVSPGTYTVIAQIGRWRRVVPGVVATSCNQTTIPTASIRMPRTQAEGDIPLTAIVTGNQEAIECWLLQVGIASSEIGPYSGTATTRVQLFQDNGQTMTGGLPAATTLFSSTVMNKFSQILLPCPTSGPQYAPTGAAGTAMANFVNYGGRVFMNHNSYTNWIESPSGPTSSLKTNSIAVFTGASGPLSYPLYGQVLNGSSSPDQQAFFAWQNIWDPLSPLPGVATCKNCAADGYVESAQPGAIFSGLGSAATELIEADNEGSGNQQWPNSPPAGNLQPLSFWANTPITANGTTTPYCGRLVENDMHVSTTRTTGGISSSSDFPANCAGGGAFPTGVPLTSEEKALEYMFFHVDACNLGTSQPVTPTLPPPPSPLAPATFTRVFQASCPVGYTVKWGFFQWQDIMPNPANGASIVFAAQTAPAVGASPGTFVPATPVNIGTTTVSSPTGMFAENGPPPVSVDSALVTAGTTSQAYLKVQMTLNPNTGGTLAPVLTTWQQLYDCIP